MARILCEVFFIFYAASSSRCLLSVHRSVLPTWDRPRSRDPMISGSCCAIVALVALLCLSQLRIFAQRRELAAARELASLASARDHRIKARLKRMHRLLRAAEVRENVSVCPPPSPVATKPASGDSATGTGTGSGTAEDGLPASLLLKAQRSWDWRAIASEALRPWGSIRKEQLDTAVAACNDNGTMYCQRLQATA